jgi:hypothetical protein
LVIIAAMMPWERMRVQQGFAAADDDQRGAEFGQAVDATMHFLDWHRRGNVVVLVAVGAGEIAAPHGDDMHLDGMVGGNEPLRDHLEFAKGPARGHHPPPHPG